MANGKWEMANGKWEMVNGKWEMKNLGSKNTSKNFTKLKLNF